MALKDKLDQEWIEKTQGDLVFRFRAATEHHYNELVSILNDIDEIASNSNFNTVDIEIKQTGQAIRQILNACKNDLDLHLDFINWTQP